MSPGGVGQPGSPRELLLPLRELAGLAGPSAGGGDTGLGLAGSSAISTNQPSKLYCRDP